MTRGLIILLLALLLGVAGFSVVRWQQHAAEHIYLSDYGRHGVSGHHPELDWLRDELLATDAQIEQISTLHAAYHPVCETLAHRLEESHRKLNTLTNSATGVSAELDAALKEHADIHLDCQRAMLKHFYETSACLTSEQSRRYLDKMLPLVFLHDTAGSEDHSH
jgi:Spy/CpxP family protein refolding chaperone